MVEAAGDETARTSVYDILREREWLAGYRARFLRNGFLDRWDGDPRGLVSEKASLQPVYRTALAEADFDIANIGAGESVGLISDLPPAGALVRRIAAQAAVLLGERA